MCIFLRRGFSEHPFLFGSVRADLLCLQTGRGRGSREFFAWLWALFTNAIMMPFEWIWDTSLSALLAATILWATLELAESRRWRDWCGYGLLWGAALMTNPALASLFRCCWDG